jgi:radical SAM protein with 4Fe4S-binding SPASM domain
VVCAENIAHVADHVHYLANDWGIRNLTILQPQCTGYVSLNSHRVSFEDFRSVYSRCLQIGEQAGAEVNASSYFNFLLPGFERTYKAGTPLESLLYGCAAGLTKVEILPNGDVYPCSYMFSRPEFLVCNVFAQDLSEAWARSPVLEVFRRRVLHGECATCPYSYVCQGGVVCENLLRTGNVVVTPPSCPLYNTSSIEEIR